MTPTEFVRIGKERGIPEDQLRTKFAELKASGAFDADPTGPDAFDRSVMDPTSGMSGTQKFFAGAGKAVSDTGQGIGQLLGVTSQKEVDEARRRDAPLMKSGAGMAGNIAGHISTMLVPGGALAKAGTGVRMLGAANKVSKLSKLGKIMSATGKGVIAPKTLKGAAATGAVYSGIQPGENRLENAAMGGLFGLGGMAAGRGLAGTYQFGKALVQPVTKAGRERIAGNLMGEFAGSPSRASAAMAKADELVPGSAPTAAEVADDAGIAQLQRSLQNASPGFADDIAQREIQQNMARVGAVEKIVSSESLSAAQTAKNVLNATARKTISGSKEVVEVGRTVGLINRILNSASGQIDDVSSSLGSIKSKLIEPYPLGDRAKDAWKAMDNIVKNPPRGAIRNVKNAEAISKARLVLSQLKDGKVYDDQAIMILRALRTKNKKTNDIINSAIKIIKSPDTRYVTKPETLYGVRQHIKTLLKNRSTPGAIRHLMAITKSLDNQIAKKVPEYRKYLKGYAEQSMVKNQGQVRDYILNKATGNLPIKGGEYPLRPDAFGRMMKNADVTAAQATGFKKAKLARVLEPEQMSTLKGVEADLTRSKAKEMGRAMGSNTSQNIVADNLMKNVLGAVGMPRSMAETTLAKLLTSPVNFASGISGADDAIRGALGKSMLDPKYGAQLMKMMESLPPSQRQKLLSSVIRGGSVMAPVSALQADQ